MSLEIFFNSGSVAGLTRLVLSAVIMVILFRGKSQTARLLGITFAGATAFNILLLVTDAMLPPFTDYLDPAETVPLLWIMIGLVPFAYHFPELVFKREEAAARFFFTLYAIVGTLLIGVQLYAAATGKLNWLDPLRLFQISGGLLGFLWSTIVMIRQWIYHTTVTVRMKKESGFNNWVREFISPSQKNARGARSFVGVFLMPTLLLATDSAFGIVQHRPEYVLNIGLLLIFFAFVMTYLNYSPETSTFMNKLLLSTLVVVLGVMSAVSNIMLPFYGQSFDNARILDLEHVAESPLVDGKLDPAALPSNLVFASLYQRTVGAMGKMLYTSPEADRNIIWETLVQENLTEAPMRVLRLSRDEAVARANKMLDRVGLAEKAAARPKNLSGGQQQRVAIARAFANDPTIILADEPTGNLDLQTGKLIIELLRQLNKERGVTIISATHDHKMLAVSDRILWVRDGKIDRIQRRDELNIQEGVIEGAGGQDLE